MYKPGHQGEVRGVLPGPDDVLTLEGKPRMARMNDLNTLVRPGTGKGILYSLVLLSSLAGCESSGWNTRLMEAFSPDQSPNADIEEKHRTAYALDRSREDLYWLLANRVDAGMARQQVDGILGEEGVREPNGQWARGGDFQVNDDVYRYGPDSTGQSVYLVFREGHLVNYDPEDFRSKRK